MRQFNQLSELEQERARYILGDNFEEKINTIWFKDRDDQVVSLDIDTVPAPPPLHDPSPDAIIACLTSEGN